MKRASSHSRLDRLDLLASRLKSGEAMTVAGLAGELGVSPRTLARDIDLLRERGLPVEADRGRGGGVRLQGNWGVGRLNLNHREAVDLLVSLAIAEQLQSPWLIANLSSIRRKLAASFSPALRDRIDGLRNRILVGKHASAAMLQGFRALEAVGVDGLLQAFLELRCLRIGYEDAQSRRTLRTVEPQMLLLNYPIWYLIGWDHARNAVRSFRCDRIVSAEIQETPFRLRPFREFESAIEGTEALRP